MHSRIRQIVAAEEQRAEKLASAVQAGWLALMAGLYFSAPMAFAADVPFEPVPWVLGLYAPLVALRVLLAQTGRSHGGWTAFAAVTDIGVLLALIFSFHIQYGQPAPFYLKAPTFAYFFLFIALRALSFDWRYVLFSGLLAATGWLAMLAFAVISEPGSVTRDYVAYIFGMKVLIGAEIDKVVTLVAVAAVLAAAVARSRRLLEQAASEAVAHRDLERFFSPEVASHILGSDQPLRAGEGALREASVLTMDLRGFTPFAHAHPPSVVLATLADYQRVVVEALFAHGGAIDKFLGDGILAHFGAARNDPAHAANCLRAAEACGLAARRWSDDRVRRGEAPMAYGIACAGGELLFGAVGDASRLELTVIGDPVNLAAKLEKHTKTLDRPIVVTRALYDLGLAQGYEPLAEAEFFAAQLVDGAPEPVDLVALNLPRA